MALPARNGMLSPTASGPAPVAAMPPARVRTDHLTGTQKAAIILRVLVAEGVDLTLERLPAEQQARLAQTMAEMRLIDRATLNAVVSEFVELLEQVGISFPDGLDNALSLLEPRLGDAARTRLRELAAGQTGPDPWARVEAAPDDALIAILQNESVVVGAVTLSRLSVERASSLLGLLPVDLAQTLAIAVARTEDMAPDAVARIGAALAQQLGARRPRAFAVPPPRRVGDMLNLSPPQVRDTLLAGIEAQDADFAQGVRKALFTFQDIATRIAPRDVGTVMREVDTNDLLVVLAAQRASEQETLDFLLANMSKRLADGLREDSAALPPPDASACDAALGNITRAVRRLVDAGTITLQKVS